MWVSDQLCVMSIGFMLPSRDEAVVWRGPRKTSLISQFVRDVDWGAYAVESASLLLRVMHIPCVPNVFWKLN